LKDQAQEPQPRRIGDRLQRSGELLGVLGLQRALQEHLEVVADRWLAQAQRLGQMADAGLVAWLGLSEL
jgi:hypothetical protein